MTLLTLFLLYLLFAIADLHPGKLKNAVFLGLVAVLCLTPDLLSLIPAAAAANMTMALPPALSYIIWGLIGVLVLAFDLFYDREGLFHQWPYLTFPWLAGFALLSDLSNPSMSVSASELLPHLPALMPVLTGLSLAVYRRELKSPVTYIRLLLLTILALAPVPFHLRWLLIVLTFAALELTRHGYRTGYERSTRAFQQRVLTNQYEEIKEMYLNMRGWRHDYHNHIQSVKAYLALGETARAQAYLDELEADLTRVDAYVRSGNLMVDAILNSKLSLAKKAQIRVDCAVQLPEALVLTDTDLCVLLGNLLDNAIEACQQIEPERRWLRVYMALNQRQLYISVQNAAKEILNFNERNYITSKRGQHGLGLMRVKLLVDRYEGFLNLQNEPGIFAAEVTLPNE